MGRSRDSDGIKSSIIISEVQKRPCLFDSNHPNYGDRAEKSRSWQEVCENVVPGWTSLSSTEQFSAGKEVQKRWRSIRDSYTKTYRQGKCVLPEQCQPSSRRYQYHKQMTFLLKALQNKKPRYSQDKYESFSEVSNSPQHPPPEDVPKIKTEVVEKPLDLKTRPVVPEMLEKVERPEKPETQDKGSQVIIENNSSLEITIDANSILPGDHFDDDRLFFNSLIPFMKKMDDDTRLLWRIETLKITRYALQGHKSFEALKTADDGLFRNMMNGIQAKEETAEATSPKCTESRLSMTTRSADGSRPVRKRKTRSPSPLPLPIKRRGPGRPRKIRPPPTDSDEEQLSKKQVPKLKVSPVDVPLLEMEDSFSQATSVAQLSTSLFMKMYNLKRTQDTPVLSSSTRNMQVSVKTEPKEEQPETHFS